MKALSSAGYVGERSFDDHEWQTALCDTSFVDVYSNSSRSSFVSLIFLARKFSSRCSIECVPGIGKTTGERERSHAKAT